MSGLIPYFHAEPIPIPLPEHLDILGYRLSFPQDWTIQPFGLLVATGLMVGTPTALEGQADPNGFTVTVRGALSETRAAQIARTNPAVDRASIINRGDHCVLDVRFVEGRSPAYRVAIVNQTVEVTIGH